MNKNICSAGLFGVALFPLYCAAATGLTEPLEPDRPDFTDSTAIVARGFNQIEAGYTYTGDRAAGVDSRDQTFPELLYRRGLSSDAELRLGWTGYSVTKVGGEETSSPNDASVGFKYRVFSANTYSVGTEANLSLPTGAGAATSGAYDPELKLILSFPFTDNLSLDTNAVAAWPTDNDKRFFQSSLSASLGIGINDNTGAFVEVYTISAESKGGDRATYADTGVSYLLSPDMSVDVRVGAGLTDAAADYFTGFGGAVRF